MHYILDATGKPVPEPDAMKWAQWFELAGVRVVKQEFVGNKIVSTVFLGLDHNYSGGPPILWETMVFANGFKPVDSDRCSGSREQAEAMHARMVEKVRQGL